MATILAAETKCSQMRKHYARGGEESFLSCSTTDLLIHLRPGEVLGHQSPAFMSRAEALGCSINFKTDANCARTTNSVELCSYLVNDHMTCTASKRLWLLTPVLLGLIIVVLAKASSVDEWACQGADSEGRFFTHLVNLSHQRVVLLRDQRQIFCARAAMLHRGVVS
jgi:hypothetical protein